MIDPKKEIKKFGVTAVVFAIPIVLFFAFSTFFLVGSGELKSLDELVTIQQNSKSSIIGLAYSNPLRYIKLQSVLKRKPTIIVMGSSQTSYFRSALFNSPDVFYNASIGGSFPQDFNIFLSRIPVKDQPKIIIAGFGSSYFDSICDGQDFGVLYDQYTESFNSSNPSLAWRFGYIQVWKDYFAGKFKLSDWKKLFSSSNFGMNGVIKDSGYRWDGTSIDTRSISKRLTEGEENFQKNSLAVYFGPERSKPCDQKFNRSVNEIKKFLSQSKSRGIHVIGYLTPHAHVVYERMKHEKSYDYVFKMFSTLEPMFREYGFKLYDFSDIAFAGASDLSMIDQGHSSENASLKMLLVMLSREPALKPYVDRSYLTKRLKTAPNDLFVFGMEEY